MTTSTPGRMPVIAFSDDADYGTLMSVLGVAMSDFIGHGWCVALVLKDGTQQEVALRFDSNRPVDGIGGNIFVDDGWIGPEVYVPLDDVVQIIVL